MKEDKRDLNLLQRVMIGLKYRIQFNYSYFGIFFFLLILLHFHTILTIKVAPHWIKSFFLLYDLGEVIIECIALVILGVVIQRFAAKWLYQFYIGCLFIFLLLQFVESALVKAMDLSLQEGIHTAFGADIKNFFELLRLSDLGMWVWYTLFIALFLSPWIGMLLYAITDKLSAKKPLALRLDALLGALCLIPIILLTIDGCVFHKLSHGDYSAYKKALPWKSTFFKVPTNKISISAPLKPIRDESKILQALSLYEPKAGPRPNIYLFVVESLRSDYMTQEIAPHLTAFKEAYIAPKIALSNANHTITSWFSIFQSAYPFYWAYSKNSHFNQGSIPLHTLKKLGYKIHLYSAAQLSYYGFDEVLLGKDKAMADTITMIPHQGMTLASDSDKAIMKQFHKDIEKHEKEGHLYLFFLDSTHFNYSWPRDFPEKFQPANEVCWTDRLFNESFFLKTLKNRYKNSIGFIDHLFANTLEALKALDRYEESIIVFCGDHGEEFKEEGKLFHASHLSPMQIHIPIFYKFGTMQKEVALSSHIDIFPSIIDYIDQENPTLKFLDGTSILKGEGPSFGVVARFNACTHPYEFLIHNGQEILLARFESKTNIFSSQTLHILQAYRPYSTKPLSQQAIKEHFENPLKELFSTH